jgi:hypothetical protein
MLLLSSGKKRHEDGGNMFHRNAYTLLPNYMVWYSRQPEYSHALW